MSKRTKPFPRIERLRELFIYEPETGRLVLRIDLGELPAGSEPGYLNDIGYRQVYFDGEIYSVHRICWALLHGEAPTGEVDHKNGVRSDNRDENLRHATSSQNNQNRRLGSRNKSGVKGVFRVKWNKGRAWRVAVGHNCGEYYITHFQCFGQAVKHAHQMRAKLHQQFARAA